MIIGISGYAQSGKDTIANYLVSNYGFVKVSFADPIRKALYALNPKINVGDMLGIRLSTAVDGLGWETLKANSAEARELLQRFGTEVGREIFGQDFWVNQAMDEARRHEKVVFSDVRYPNEIEAILGASGASWRVIKDGVEAVNDHSSENALDSHDFNQKIYNTGSKKDLYAKIDYLINH